ncbi:MAG: aromatic amino acid transport family protein [Candidatus Nanoarchaeia archaeon]|jgi:amino acid permease
MDSKFKSFLLGLATLMGTVIGAGFLGIPKALTLSGYFQGAILMIVVAFFMFVMCLFATELTLNTKAVYQMPGMIRKYLGKGWGVFTSIIFLLISVGAIIAYLLGSSKILSNLTGINQTYCMIAYFAVIFIFVFKGLNSIKKAAFFIELVLFTFLIIMAFFLRGDFAFVNLNFPASGNLIIPFGVILFSFGGYNIMAQVEQITKSNKDLMVKISFFGMILSFVFFLAFATIILGVFGNQVSDIATESLTGVVGLIGNMIALFAMTGSFIMSGLLLKDMLVNDYTLNPNLSSFLAMFFPLLFIMLFGPSFINTLAFTGAVVAGIFGVILCITIIYERKKIAKFYYKAPFGNVLPIITAIFFLLGIISTLL